ncbi:hypothetical protein ACOT81_27910 [Streptomyces sp. WI04-05B]|uniref:hypothetical protein n=1 Tax=Streptomyces TaxID=1883 RepID=UPI0029BDE060|nr:MULTISPECIES: hypothetical protein [unclassified Streptomyces]MDX2546769.1 hypothetical protein [Streptomyces sp. WI04-05B]MDX2589565.1 hypothetical protein [Streptomyces sp. WI04-05A]MDX3750641.1 hypothetical protein [Streptomyces sp. AK08-02]
MRKSQGRRVVGARAVALTVAVGVAAATGIASTSWASAQPTSVEQLAKAEQKCSGYSAAEIILGFMGQGVVAKQYPDLALVQGKVVGATPRDVEVFLALASLRKAGFAEKFRADVTSGDPFRVRDALERLDAMGVAVHKDGLEGPVDSGNGDDSTVVLINFNADKKDTDGPVDSGKGDRSTVILISFNADFEVGKSGLTTEKAVSIVTKLLAGK